MPVRYKVHGRILKFVLKHLARKFLPQELIDRPKMGFALPIAQWINTQWREMSQELVLGERALKRGNFCPTYLNRILAEHRQGRRDHSYVIWTLMFLEIWFRSYIDANN
jgi:asparagine synthase (glutamine-hydrolysing)